MILLGASQTMKNMKLILFASLLFIFSFMFLQPSFSLSIDPFVTHNKINSTISADSTLMFSMKSDDLERPLGFQLRAVGDDSIKVQVKDQNGKTVNMRVTYATGDENDVWIEGELNPKMLGEYYLEISNLGEQPTHVTGTFGTMLSADDIRQIEEKYPGGVRYDPMPSFVILIFIGASIGLTIGYFAFGRKKKVKENA